ncbi:hypothetical protein ACQEV4_40435 [Streptomyces shenzhenensis]|uniref:hypothetical protein n=1 Tax=Streptomyces shenzhenensis TaxID=943815 RepID=UPI003D8BFBAD
MRIEILAVPSVSDGAGNRYRTGRIVDVDDDQARAWVDAGHARRVSGRSATKRTAARKPPKTAAPSPGPQPGGGPPEGPGAGDS